MKNISKDIKKLMRMGIIIIGIHLHVTDSKIQYLLKLLVLMEQFYL